MVFFGRRYYEPTTGRFLTPDPLGFADGPNLYAYVHNSPLILIDPYGLLSMEETWEGTKGVGSGLYNALWDDSLGSLSRTVGYSNSFPGNFSELSPSEQMRFRGKYAGEALGTVANGCFIWKSMAQMTVRTTGGIALKETAKKVATKEAAKTAEKTAWQKVKGWFKGSEKNEGPATLNGAAGPAKTQKPTGHGERLRPDPMAKGDHSVFRYNPQKGRVDKHETFRPQTNPRNPNPWEPVTAYHENSDGHYNKVLKKRIGNETIPHVHDRLAPGGVREAHPFEIPGGGNK